MWSFHTFSTNTFCAMQDKPNISAGISNKILHAALIEILPSWSNLPLLILRDPCGWLNLMEFTFYCELPPPWESVKLTISHYLMFFRSIFLNSIGNKCQGFDGGCAGCPVGEAAMAWTVLVTTSPVPLVDAALTEAGIWGQLMGDTLGVGSSCQCCRQTLAEGLGRRG